MTLVQESTPVSHVLQVFVGNDRPALIWPHFNLTFMMMPFYELLSQAQTEACVWCSQILDLLTLLDCAWSSHVLHCCLCLIHGFVLCFSVLISAVKNRHEQRNVLHQRVLAVLHVHETVKTQSFKGVFRLKREQTDTSLLWTNMSDRVQHLSIPSCICTQTEKQEEIRTRSGVNWNIQEIDTDESVWETLQRNIIGCKLYYYCFVWNNETTLY